MGQVEREREAFTLRTGIHPEDLRQLGKVPLFSGFIPDEMRKLLATSSIRRYPNHTTLFMEGDPAARFFVVLEGWVKLYRACEDGREVVISVISPGESFAEAAIFASSTYPVSAATVSDARLLVISAESMTRELRSNMDLTFNMLSSMSLHMRKNITLVHQLSAMSASERLADFLLNLCPDDEGEVEITLPLDKSLIAARLGMQPETFSRTLGKLKDAGVSSSGHAVVITDVTALRRTFKRGAPECC